MCAGHEDASVRYGFSTSFNCVCLHPRGRCGKHLIQVRIAKLCLKSVIGGTIKRVAAPWTPSRTVPVCLCHVLQNGLPPTRHRAMKSAWDSTCRLDRSSIFCLSTAHSASGATDRGSLWISPCFPATSSFASGGRSVLVCWKYLVCWHLWTALGANRHRYRRLKSMHFDPAFLNATPSPTLF